MIAKALCIFLLLLFGATCGGLVVGVIAGSSMADKEYVSYRKGYREGYRVGSAEDSKVGEEVMEELRSKEEQ